MTTDQQNSDTLEPDSSTAHNNNFDIIRLLAALQVVFGHGYRLLHTGASSAFVHAAVSILSILPGVPIFYCISGFLIARSLERHLDELRVYFWARALRIYPALWLCVTIGGLTLWQLGYFHTTSAASVAQRWFLNLVAGGASINPDFLRSFGPGVWNGALWTIFVELSFYIALPIIYVLCHRARVSINAVLVFLLVASFLAFIAARGLEFGDTKAVGVIQKVIWYSLAGNLWMFLFGTLAHRFWPRLAPFIQEKFLFWLGAYLLVSLTLGIWLEPIIKGVSFAAGSLFIRRGLLAILVLSAAYSGKALSNRLLHRNDLSYGIYLYHSFIFSLFVHFGRFGLPAFTAGLGASLGAAAFSWFFLERKALTLKFVKQQPSPNITRPLYGASME